jgi:hypothetical protein
VNSCRHSPPEKGSIKLLEHQICVTMEKCHFDLDDGLSLEGEGWYERFDVFTFTFQGSWPKIFSSVRQSAKYC